MLAPTETQGIRGSGLFNYFAYSLGDNLTGYTLVDMIYPTVEFITPCCLPLSQDADYHGVRNELSQTRVATSLI